MTRPGTGVLLRRLARLGGHDGTELSLDGAGDPVDGLRALCAAAWSLDQVSPEMVRPGAGRARPAGPLRISPAGSRPAHRLRSRTKISSAADAPHPSGPEDWLAAGKRAPGPAPTKGHSMIEARGLTKRYGDKLAVDHLSFTVEPGPDHRLPRPERGGQDHHDAADPRAWTTRPSGSVTVNGKAFRQLRPPDARSRRAAGRQGRARRPQRLQPPAVPGPDQRPAPRAGSARCWTWSG